MNNYPPGVTDADIDAHHGPQWPDPDSREAAYERDRAEALESLSLAIKTLNNMTGRAELKVCPTLIEFGYLHFQLEQARQKFVQFADKWNQFV